MIQRDRIIDLVEARDWESLLAPPGGGPCLSLTLPTIRKGQETLQNPVRLKNLLRKTEEELGRFLGQSEVEEWLAPMWRLQSSSDFQQHQAEGLALFRSRELLAAYRLPYALEEEVHVGSCFFVRPLVPLRTGGERFYVLALDASGVSLYRGERFDLEMVDLGDTPTSMDEFLKHEEEEKSIQFHSGTGDPGPHGQRPAMFHGQGIAGDDARQKTKLLEFFRRLDAAVRDRIGGGQDPLVLVGEETNRGLYRTANQYGSLQDRDIPLHPKSLPPDELHARSREAVAATFESTRQEALDGLTRLAAKNDPRAAMDMETVVPAAANARVETLFVPPQPRVWGRLREDGMGVSLAETPGPEDEELINLAVVHTMRTGGTVMLVERADLPGGGTVAATLRF